MTKLFLIITFILYGIAHSRQIGYINDHIFTYQVLLNDSAITTITFNNTSSCNACVCAAFMSTIDYIAINCYKKNNTCSLLTSSVNIIGMNFSANSASYILSSTSIITTKTSSTSTSTSSSSTTTTTTSSTSTSTSSSSTTTTTTTTTTTITTKTTTNCDRHNGNSLRCDSDGKG